MAIQFRKAGYKGKIKLEQTGTGAGIAQFCGSSKGPDIVNASRAVLRKELEACQKVMRTPLEFMVGTDALSIVTSQKNDFLQDLSVEQLRDVFTDYQNWSEVDPSFPDAPINRYMPDQDSGTLDSFVDATFIRSMEEVSTPELVAVLSFYLSPGRVKALNAEQPLVERSPDELLTLVNAEVIKPRIVKSWDLVQSLLEKPKIEAETAKIDDATLEFRNWLTWEFLTTTQSSIPEYAGIRTAILGSLWVIVITMAMALPLGVGAAIYLEEYATMAVDPTVRRINSIIQTNINNLAGVPSIIYGLLGLAVFARAMENFTSGAMFGFSDPATANGRTILAAGLTLGLLILPLLIINSQEAIRAVPQSLRLAGMGLGATKWQTIRSHVLPNAIPGILTGNILAVSRALGETAPLVVLGASTFITTDPGSPFAKFTTLPMLIYNWTSRPQAEFQHIAAAGIIVLLVLLLTLNASAVLLRNRYSRKLG
jgi:phosphate transport system permease protein